MDEKIRRVAREIVESLNRIEMILTVPKGKTDEESSENFEAARQRAIKMVATIIERGLQWESPRG